MRKLMVLWLLALISLGSMAQMPNRGGGARMGQMPNGRFYGKVVDAAHKGIEAASITLVQKRMDSITKQPKEVVVSGMLTSNNGNFSLENIPLFGKYTLKITGIGYKPYEQSVAFQLPNRSAAAGNDPNAMLGALDKDLGNIKLEIDGKLLGNVTVTSSKPLYQMGIDRKVFNVEKNMVSAGGSAIDVMKNVPSLSVDIDGNVSLRNNTPQIFVDGRPTTLTLEQIPADAIESVEVITNPSAKFDASGGTAGILNIVLKKNKRVGYSGNIRVNGDSRGRVGGGGDINIRQGKVNFFASANIMQRKSNSSGTTDRSTTQGNTITDLLQKDQSTQTGAFGFGRAGFDFFVDNRNTISVSGTMARGKMSPYTTSDIFIDSLSSAKSYYDQRFSNTTSHFNHGGTQLSYKHIFPKAGRELTADVTYNNGTNTNNNTIQTNYYNVDNTDQKSFDRTYKQIQMGTGQNDNTIIQSDYTNPINDHSKFEAGVRAAIRNVNSANNYFAANPDGSLTALPKLDVAYNSKDQVYAAYSTYSNQIKNFGYQLGLRAESSNYHGELLSKNQPFDIKFPISLFPSVFLSEKLKGDNELQLNYSRRINRPNFWQLFPFTDYSDSLNLSRGNPGLKPEFTNSIELSYSKMFKNRDNFLASLYFKNTNDLITRYQFNDSDAVIKKNVLISTYINANKSYITGLELTSKNKITNWWDLTSNLNLFTAKIEIDSIASQPAFLSYFAKINNSFKLPKNFSLQLSADYQSKIISSPNNGGGGFGRGGGMFGGPSSAAQGFIRANYGVDAAIRFDFLKNKTASVSLNVNDLLKTRKYDAHSEGLGFVQDIQRVRDQQIFRLNFNYRFGKFDASLFRRKNNKAETDQGLDTQGF